MFKREKILARAITTPFLKYIGDTFKTKQKSVGMETYDFFDKYGQKFTLTKIQISELLSFCYDQIVNSCPHILEENGYGVTLELMYGDFDEVKNK